MFKVLLLLCSLHLISHEALDAQESKHVQHSSICNKLSNVGYYGTGLAAFYAASLVLFDKCQESHGKMVGVLCAAGLGTWLLKETFRDMGLTWINLKKELEEFKDDRDAYANAMQVDLSSGEKILGEMAQKAYLFPKYYWREMMSLPSALLLLKYAYKVLFKDIRRYRYN